MLGIGADDVFCLYDAYKQSQFEPRDTVSGSTLARVLYTSRRASKAILVTSFTTMGAFFAQFIRSHADFRVWNIKRNNDCRLVCSERADVSTGVVFVLFVFGQVQGVLLLHESGLQEDRKVRFGGDTTTLSISSLEEVVDEGNTRSHKETINGKDEEDEAILNGGGEDNASSSSPRPMDTLFDSRLTSNATSNRTILPQPVLHVHKLPSNMLCRHSWFLNIIRVFVKTRARTRNACAARAVVPNGTFDASVRERCTRFSVSADDRVVPLDVCFGVRGMDTSNANHWDIDQVGKLQLDEAFDITPPASQLHLLHASRR